MFKKNLISKFKINKMLMLNFMYSFIDNFFKIQNQNRESLGKTTMIDTEAYENLEIWKYQTENSTNSPYNNKKKIMKMQKNLCI